MGAEGLMSESRILAVHPGALGDCVLFGQLLRRLGGLVTLVAGGRLGGLLAGCGVVDQALDFNALPMHEIFTDRPPDRCGLGRLLGRHDRLISCFGAGNRRAEQRLAAMCACRAASFLPTRPNAGQARHLFDLWCNMLSLPTRSGDGLDAWAVRQDWRDEAQAELDRAGVDPTGGYHVIHPGAAAPAKCWPLERFAALADRLGRAVFTVGPVEVDRWPGEVMRGLAGRFPVLTCLRLEVLAGLLAGAEGFVGNDSGPAHLAAAVGAPTVALFGPTRPEQFAPLGRAVRTVRAEPIDNITTDDVLARLEELPCRNR